MSDVAAHGATSSAQPPSALPPTPQGLAPSLRRRWAAALYESVLLFGVCFIAGYLWSTLTQQRHALQLRHGLMGFVFIMLGVYFMWFWTHGGQTLAQKTWNIRVLRNDGSALTQGRALARYVASWLWLLPALALAMTPGLHGGLRAVMAFAWLLLYPLTSLLHPRRQFWHDALCGTQLVSSVPGAQPGTAQSSSPKS